MKGQTDSPARVALISLGSNLHPELNLPAALDLLSSRLAIISKSSIWQTPAVGVQGPDYLNAAALIETRYSQAELKSLVLSEIENQLGRVRQQNKFADRTIDLDVLIYAGDVLDQELWEQAHLAVPAAELLPDLVNPSNGETLARAASRLLPGKGFVKRPDLPG